MKTLTTLIALVLCLWVLPVNAQQKLSVPEYSLDGATKFLRERHFYLIDRNKDGKVDLVHIENYYPEFSNCKIITIVIDDNYDGIPDRILTDGSTFCKSGGADGIFDVEKPSSADDKEYFDYFNKNK